ncbi:hypothetical protein ACIO02_33910 [Streptomyces sp. NPDC087568]|uniref:hypothetical protein n=1 Tax=unclassified Streptomyces TaxID=2593676 RepID=UPI0036E2F85E
MTTTSKTTKPRRPDNQPFDFNLDAVEPEQELLPFVVQYGGTRWAFKHLQELDCWDLLDAAREGEVGAMLGSFKGALGKQYDDFRKLGMPQFKIKALFRAWQEHCGLNEDGTPINDDTSD